MNAADFIEQSKKFGRLGAARHRATEIALYARWLNATVEQCIKATELLTGFRASNPDSVRVETKLISLGTTHSAVRDALHSLSGAIQQLESQSANAAQGLMKLGAKSLPWHFDMLDDAFERTVDESVSSMNLVTFELISVGKSIDDIADALRETLRKQFGAKFPG